MTPQIGPSIREFHKPFTTFASVLYQMYQPSASNTVTHVVNDILQLLVFSLKMIYIKSKINYLD